MRIYTKTNPENYKIFKRRWKIVTKKLPSFNESVLELFEYVRQYYKVSNANFGRIIGLSREDGTKATGYTMRKHRHTIPAFQIEHYIRFCIVFSLDLASLEFFNIPNKDTLPTSQILLLDTTRNLLTKEYRDKFQERAHQIVNDPVIASKDVLDTLDIEQGISIRSDTLEELPANNQETQPKATTKRAEILVTLKERVPYAEKIANTVKENLSYQCNVVRLFYELSVFDFFSLLSKDEKLTYLRVKSSATRISPIINVESLYYLCYVFNIDLSFLVSLDCAIEKLSGLPQEQLLNQALNAFLSLSLSDREKYLKTLPSIDSIKETSSLYFEIDENVDEKPSNKRRTAKSRLSESDRKEIVNLLNSSVPVSKIAETFNISSPHVYHIARTSDGVTRKRRLSESEQEKVVSLLNSSVPAPKIAETFNISVPQVYYIARKHTGVNRRDKRSDTGKERNQKIYASWVSGKSVESLASEYDLSVGYVCKIIRNINPNGKCLKQTKEESIAKRNESIAKDFENGLTFAELSQKYNLGPRTVKAILKKLTEDTSSQVEDD